ncbi:hypothetical protein THAOC_22978 [Thalassiosira oceanica]|uniref:MYND-type domain-containing protein n=1 Tax=Thalassiosira oceanica TaxID=159749 RepID=K0RX48_THAOC|nr:hypothetical protein THAOC_22978 [Thalassiosira oceanica]|eukprot:EJK57024.1 hypothetical protein THAOC_22978 [Thalassiosira oceanica]
MLPPSRLFGSASALPTRRPPRTMALPGAPGSGEGLADGVGVRGQRDVGPVLNSPPGPPARSARSVSSLSWETPCGVPLLRWTCPRSVIGKHEASRLLVQDLRPPSVRRELSGGFILLSVSRIFSARPAAPALSRRSEHGQSTDRSSKALAGRRPRVVVPPVPLALMRREDGVARQTGQQRPPDGDEDSTFNEVSVGFNSDITKAEERGGEARSGRAKERGGEFSPVSGSSSRVQTRQPLCLQKTSSLSLQDTHPSTSLYTMSCVPVDCESDSCEACANCGKQGSDTVKLKSCTACRLVKYCGVDCQRAHRKQHKKACKQRAAELKDEQLYSQGHERPEGDFCPICTLPIPLPMGDHSVFNVCCMKRICNGCNVAAQERGMFDCPFCRTRYPDNDADTLAMIQIRVAKKDPVAISQLGLQYFFGWHGLQKDMRRAVELYTEAAEFGSIQALFDLGNAYCHGEGVQEDKAKAAEFYEKAAMQGHTQSRHNLGYLEALSGNHDRAVRHLLISAKMGYKDSLESIEEAFMVGGVATKEQYAEALKGYQAAVEEMKSHDRDEAKRLGHLVEKKDQEAINALGTSYSLNVGLLDHQPSLLNLDVITLSERFNAAEPDGEGSCLTPPWAELEGWRLAMESNSFQPPLIIRAPTNDRERTGPVLLSRHSRPGRIHGHDDAALACAGAGFEWPSVSSSPAQATLRGSGYPPGARPAPRPSFCVPLLHPSSPGLVARDGSALHFQAGGAVGCARTEVPPASALPGRAAEEFAAEATEGDGVAGGAGVRDSLIPPHVLSRPSPGRHHAECLSTDGHSRARKRTLTLNEVSDRFQLRHHESRERKDHGQKGSPARSGRKQGNDCSPADRRQSRKRQAAPRVRRRRDGDGDPALSIHWPIVPSTSFYTMSCVPVVVDGDEVCANCGKQGSDTVKLKNCTACRLVKYCGVDCQRAHRKQHKKACKQRAAELKDEQLYSRGHERPEGDFCPICTLPIPLPMDENSSINVCCMKRICDGCAVAVGKRGMLDCAFCRTSYPGNDADKLAMVQARVAKKDPVAINFLGEQYFYGKLGLQKDTPRAVELYTEAAERGSIIALFNLGAAQDHGVKKGNHGRALRHYLISAKLGHKDSLEMVKMMFMAGLATKEQYAEALKGYQDAVEEMKSPQRDEAMRLGY